MLQIANGGVSIEQIDGEVVDFFTSSPVYFEPGFNFMQELFFTSTEVDTIHMLLRKREDNTGKFFEEISTSEFDVKIIDMTTNKNLNFSFTENNINNKWNTDDFSPLVLSIDTESQDENDQEQKIRNMTVRIKEVSSNNFIIFKIVLDTDSRPFAFLPVKNKEISRREEVASFANETLIDLSDNGLYLILSPFSTFEETNEEDADFSYPIDRIHYKLENNANAESYTWEINDTSHDAIENNVKIFPLPGFPQIGILLLDGRLRDDVIGLEGQTWLKISAKGNSSGNIDIFKMFFAKSNGICVI